MKLTPLLLGISVAANAALIVVVARNSSRTDAVEKRDSIGSEHTTARSKNANTTVDGTEANRRMETDQASAPTVVKWESMDRADLKSLVARLRAAGYPATAIRGIVMARLEDQLAARRKQLTEGLQDAPYWQTGRAMTLNPKFMTAQREYHQEQRRMLRELLGDDAVQDDEFTRYWRQRQFGSISPEKAESLQRILSDYGELRQDVYVRSNGMLLPEDREQISFLERSMREDLAASMSPQELEDYELRSSNTANSLRSQLTTFQPTEQEFRALFQAAKSVEEQFGTSQGAMSQEERRKRQAALNEQAKAILSPERYAAFEQATDPNYGSLNRIAARYELPATVVPQVYQVQQDIQRRASELRALPAEQRAASLAALAQEATTRIAPLLGEKALEAYKVYGGQWIQGLTQPPRPSTAPAPQTKKG